MPALNRRISRSFRQAMPAISFMRSEAMQAPTTWHSAGMMVDGCHSDMLTVGAGPQGD